MVVSYGDNIDSPLCGGLYKEEEDSLVPWSGTIQSSFSLDQVNLYTLASGYIPDQGTK